MTLLQALATHAQDNPFEQAAQQNYSGRFQGEGVELRLLPEVGRWKGTVLLKGKNFTVEAEAKGTGLEGKYVDGEQAWPFTGIVNGDRFTFTSGTFTSTLTRQRLPKLEGRWRSEHVLILFDKTPGKFGGRIQYSGGEFAFAAEEKAGDLEGVFKAGDKSFPFRVANEARGLVFNTGSFAEVITQVPNRGTLRVQTTPAVTFTLRNGGEAVSGRDGVFAVPGGQTLALELTAKGCYPARTNLTVPAYGMATWTVTLEKLPYPTLETARWTNSLGMVFVPVSGTKVLFSIWDTRVQDYQAFAQTTGRSVQKPGFEQDATHPVVNVSWDDAKAFCDWLTRKERASGKLDSAQSYRLATDGEWSVAVGLPHEPGNTPEDKNSKILNVQPWGTQWPPPRGAGNYDKSLGVDDFAYTSPVGSFASNRFGLFDMGGNVWQWCEDWYNSRQENRVLRGASWFSDPISYLPASMRFLWRPDRGFQNIGFRVVLVEGLSR